MDVGKCKLPGSVGKPRSDRSEQNVVTPKKSNAEITSRYKSGNSPVRRQRCPSPIPPRKIPEPVQSKRPLSAERSRPTSSFARPSSPSLRSSRPSSPSPGASTPVCDSVVDTEKSSRRLAGTRTTDGLWPSMRSLSSSLNIGSVSKKEKVSDAVKSSVSVPSERKRTPLRGRNAANQLENSSPQHENSLVRGVDQHRLLGLKGAKLSPSAMTRSMDLTDKCRRTTFSSSSLKGVSPSRRNSESSAPVTTLRKSTSDGARRLSLDGTKRTEALDLSAHSVASEKATSLAHLSRRQSLPNVDAHGSSATTKDSLPSLTSKCASSPSRVRPSTSDGRRRIANGGIRGAGSGASLNVSADFSEKVASLSSSSRIQSLPSASARRPLSPSRTLLSSQSPKSTASPSRTRSFTSDAAKRIYPKASRRADSMVLSDLSSSTDSSDIGVSVSCSTSRTRSLPVSGPQRQPSPSRTLLLSSSRSSPSPLRARPSTPCRSSVTDASQTGTTSNVISYMIDVPKGKKNVNHIEDVHHFRILYNRYLQWRFVNARVETELSFQKIKAESNLYGMSVTSMELLGSVVMKKIKLLQARKEMKLKFFLKKQVPYLEGWAFLEKEHHTSLSGAIGILRECTICLPVTDGARAEVIPTKDAISSAVDVMQVMGSSICHLLSKVDGTNTLVSELASLATKQRTMLAECRDLLASITAMQVQESSLMTQLFQLRRDIHNVGHAHVDGGVEWRTETSTCCS